MLLLKSEPEVKMCVFLQSKVNEGANDGSRQNAIKVINAWEFLLPFLQTFAQKDRVLKEVLRWQFRQEHEHSMNKDGSSILQINLPACYIRCYFELSKFSCSGHHILGLTFVS